MYQILLVFLFISIGACNFNKACKLNSPERIQTIELSDDGRVSYLHEIEITGASLNCDSTTLMTAIYRYINSNNHDNPISGIEVFKSRRNFDAGETLSQPKKYYEDQVIAVYFDESTKRPKHFIFYNDGDRVYEGNNWYQ